MLPFKSTRQRSQLLWIFLLAILKAFFVRKAHGSAHGHYELYNTGIAFIDLAYLDFGIPDPNQKWLAECFDGQALVGLRCNGDDFEDLTTAKCRTAFPGKQSTHGYYPYYERCQVRNITHREEFLCFDPKNYPNSVNTFITAIWDDDDSFLVWSFRTTKPYIGSAFKCCGTPPGYEIDYTSCQIRYTHNEHWEYYDTTYFVMECPDTFVMTGIGIVANPIDYDLHYDWIQCCPLIYTPVPAYVSQQLFGSPGLDVHSFREFQHYYADPVPEDFTIRKNKTKTTTTAPTAGSNGTATTTTMKSIASSGTKAGAAFGVQLLNSQHQGSESGGSGANSNSNEGGSRISNAFRAGAAGNAGATGGAGAPAFAGG